MSGRNFTTTEQSDAPGPGHYSHEGSIGKSVPAFSMGGSRVVREGNGDTPGPGSYQSDPSKVLISFFFLKKNNICRIINLLLLSRCQVDHHLNLLLAVGLDPAHMTLSTYYSFCKKPDILEK